MTMRRRLSVSSFGGNITLAFPSWLEHRVTPVTKGKRKHWLLGCPAPLWYNRAWRFQTEHFQKLLGGLGPTTPDVIVVPTGLSATGSVSQPAVVGEGEFRLMGRVVRVRLVQ